MASDSTGTRLVAVNVASLITESAPDGGLSEVVMSGDIWTSADAGATWTNRTTGSPASGQRWWSVASDSNGTHLVAAAGPSWGTSTGGDVWTSADAGATWAKRTTVSSNTQSPSWAPTVVSDSTGSHLALANGDIWTSTDAGATWSNRTMGTSAGGQDWVDLASDSTVTHLVALTVVGDIWTSSDSAATWTNRTKGTAASGLPWQAVASDSTGTHLVALCQPFIPVGGVPQGNSIWTSADSGTTWTNGTTGAAAAVDNWQAVASDASGAHLVAASAHGNNGDGNDLWTSGDYGATWSNVTAGTKAAGQQWSALASDATGSHLVAVTIGGPGVGLGPPCCDGDVWTN